MALPWEWILDKLARLPDVSIDALRELSSYVPNAGQNQPLQRVLALRQLHEMLVSSFEEEPAESETTAGLVAALASPDEDINRLLELAGDPNSPAAKKELFQYVQQKRAGLETPVIDKIASDFAAGVYPPGSAKAASDPGHKVVNNEVCVEEKSSRRHLSVGSEDTTVIIEGEEVLKDKHDKNASSGLEKGKLDVVLLDEKTDATFIKSCKRICRGFGTKLFKQKEAEEKAREEEKSTAAEAEENPKPANDVDKQPETFRVPRINEHVNTSRRSKRVVLEEDSDEEDKKAKVSEEKQRQEEADLKAPEPAKIDHGDMCFKCNRRGELLCCDGCPIAVHVKCVDLTPDQVPEGQWFCPSCVYRQALEIVAKAEEDAVRAKLEMERALGSAAGFVKRESITRKRSSEPLPATRVKVEAAEARKVKSTTSDEDFMSEEPSGSESSDHAGRKPRSGREFIPHLRRQKMRWTAAEEELLREGVKKYESQWTKILNLGMGKFHPSRTGTDLKDKWRNLSIAKHNKA